MGGLTFKDLWSRKRRLLGMFTAVMVGVAFLAGTLVLGDTVRDSFGSLFTEANSGTSALVRSEHRMTTDGLTEQAAIPRSMVAQVRAVDGVAAAAPLVEGNAQLVGADGDRLGGNGPPTRGSNWVTDAALNPWHIVDGRAPAAVGEVVIDRAAANKGDLHVGSTTTVLVPQPVQVTVVGIAKFGTSDSMAGTTFTAFTTPEAQQLFLGGRDELTGVLVAADPGVSQAQLIEQLQPALPAGATAITGRALTAEQQSDVESAFIGFFETVLLVFAAVALLVAAFSIYNAFSMLTAQRTRESALLRALGASRRQITTSAATQGLVVGGLAAIAGVVVGIALAAGLYALMSAAGFGLPETGLAIEPARLVLAAAVGVAVAVPASLVPAVRASRVRPLAAMREGTDDVTAPSRLRTGCGLVGLAAGIALVVLGASDVSFALVGPGALLTLVALVLLGPAVARPVSALLGTPATALRGATGSLARRNAMRNPRTTAGAATALMVGVAVVTVFTVFGASIKASIGDVVRNDFRGDLVMVHDAQSGAGIDPALVGRLESQPEVGEATGFGITHATVSGDTLMVTAADPAELGRMIDLHVARGALDDIGPDGVAVSSRFANQHGLDVGSSVPVTFADGKQVDLRVGAVYDANMSFGDVVVPEVQWLANTQQPALTGLFVALADGVAIEDGRRAVQDITRGAFAPKVQDRAEYLDGVSSQVDTLLAIVYVFLALAILIAFMGIANTLSLSLRERTRELGLLRAVGLTRSQLRATVRWESVIIAGFGVVGGIAVGMLVGWGLIRSISGDMPLDVFAAPTGRLLLIAGAGAAAGVLAAVRPARRAARLPVLSALAGD
jgi:putative ABC transport system permease protein